MIKTLRYLKLVVFMHTILITFHNFNKIMTKNHYVTKKITNTSNKKYIFFLFIANASCTIKTNRTLNSVYKCFTINQIYIKIFTFFQSSKLIHMQSFYLLDFQDLIVAFLKGFSIF